MNGEMREWMGGRFSNATNPSNPSVLLFITRRGTVHAAREGRHLHGGHCLVRTALLGKCLPTVWKTSNSSR